MKISFFLFSFLFSFVSMFSAPIQTDYAVFLFDHGDKNMVASMLNYGETYHKSALDVLDFRIVFMGASIDAMDKEPFSHYPDKLIHYKSLGIEELIDYNWQRDQLISQKSVKALSSHLSIQKKVWTGVSARLFTQVLKAYPVENLALRDNPYAEGNTDYFPCARVVQQSAFKVAVPSELLLSGLENQVVVGHPSIEEWQSQAKQIQQKVLLERLKIDPNLPILIYVGSYGDFYEEAFSQFLKLLQSEKLDKLHLQVVIVPHPRYKGAVEKRFSDHFDHNLAKFVIVGEWEEDPLKKLKTIEALAIGDVVITSDVTSTVVLQAGSLQKKVGLINPIFTEISQKICQIGVIEPVFTENQLLEFITKKDDLKGDVFSFLKIPKEGGRLLWEEWIGEKP